MSLRYTPCDIESQLVPVLFTIHDFLSCYQVSLGSGGLQTTRLLCDRWSQIRISFTKVFHQKAPQMCLSGLQTMLGHEHTSKI